LTEPSGKLRLYFSRTIELAQARRLRETTRMMKKPIARERMANRAGR
jgi:hypothetical protein